MPVTLHRAVGPRGPALATLLLVPPLLLLCGLMLRSTYLLHYTQHAIHLGGESQTMFSSSGGSGGGASRQHSNLSAEVWGGFAPLELAAGAPEVLKLLEATELKELEDLCGRCLFEQLKMTIGYGNGHKYFVATGDIPEMWIRDSAVQLGVLLPRISQRPALRLLVEGAVRTQAFFIVQDPYANAYYLKWRQLEDHSKFERLIGRAGWVGTRNYELDSGAYFIQLLWNLHSLPGYGRDLLLAEPVVFEAVNLLVHTWTVEQHHEQQSTYRYSELPRGGKGDESGYTGMSWCGFRPSDDQQTYGYNVAVNMYAQAAVERALQLNAAIWRDAAFESKASQLARTMKEGIEKFGVVEVAGVKVYAYEVDGLGGQLVDYDDANVPSLLSIPLLGYAYDPAIYQATRQRILSPKNPMFFKGSLYSGIGSQHTAAGMAWPLAVAVRGLTAGGAGERADALRTMLKLQCGNGLMHESVDVNQPEHCTRPWFGWANAMLVAMVEATTGIDCAVPAERLRLARIVEREAADTQNRPANGGADDPLYYETLESTIVFDTDRLQPPKGTQLQLR